MNIDDALSRPFNGFDWSEHPNVTTLTDYLLDDYIDWYKGNDVTKRIRDKDKIKQHMIHFILEAFRNYQALPELCMGVHLGKQYYTDNQSNRYHPNHLSYRFVINITNFLTTKGYLEMPYGKSEWNPNPKYRRTTRYRATEHLISLCKDYGITRFMITTYAEPEIIILKDKKAKNQSSGLVIDYQDTAFTIQARKNLKNINDFIGKQCLNLDITDKQHNDLLTRLRQHTDITKAQYIDFTKITLRRIFNNASFEQGGRFYGAWWQQIPSDYRLFITINGKKTSQLDYSGMHFSIMYAQAGMALPMADPYALEGYDTSLRSDIKIAFNAIVNCKSERQAIQTVNYYIRQGELSLELISGEKVIEEFIKLHPAIKDKIASGEGIKGHFIDSQIAEKILLKGVDYGIPILPIHDGFITTSSCIHILNDWMLEAFKDVTGHSVIVKPETFNLSILDNAGQQPFWVTRKNGSSERNGSLEGKAISYSTLPNKHTLEKLLREDTLYKNYRNTINKDWNAVYE